MESKVEIFAKVHSSSPPRSKKNLEEKVQGTQGSVRMFFSGGNKTYLFCSHFLHFRGEAHAEKNPPIFFFFFNGSLKSRLECIGKRILFFMQKLFSSLTYKVFFFFLNNLPFLWKNLFNGRRKKLECFRCSPGR